MTFHSALTGAAAYHPIYYAQNGDPGAVGAGKLWLDTTNGADIESGAVLKERNGANSGWTTRVDLTALRASVGYHDAGNSSTAQTINWATASTQRSTLTGNCTYTFSNPVAGQVYILLVVQDGTGTRTVTWPGAVHWSGGTAPTLTTTINKVDIFTFAYDGTTYFGVTSGLNYTA